MFKLDLEKAEEPEIKLPTSIGSQNKQDNSRKTSISASLAMPKTIQTTVQWHSFHMLAIVYSKPFKLGFSSTRTESFQMYKLDLEKAEESDFKLPTSAGS